MKKGILIHPEELSSRWIERAAALGADTVGLHPAGGKNAADTLAALLMRLRDPAFRALIDDLRARGIAVEYEMHAAGYLLPRSMFESHPEYFRMDENGVRNPDRNLCVSNPEALSLLAERAAKLALQLYGSTHRFYFWMDDVRGRFCRCPACRKLTGSDQQLIAVNAMLTAVRRVIPDAEMAYIAYIDCVEPPKNVRPAPGVFLEYAPIERYVAPDSEEGRARVDFERDQLAPLLDFFGRERAKILEYWLDNSLFSGWKKPPKPFTLNADAMRADAARYRAAGVREIAVFACFLGADYEQLWGEPDLTAFGEDLDTMTKEENTP